MSMASRITDRDDWFDLWVDDTRSTIACMVSNMQADLACGYDPQGLSMTMARIELAEYRSAFDRQMDAFKLMDDKSVNRWCFYELKKTGAID